jgi:hypothetical protein
MLIVLVCGCNWGGGTDPNACFVGNERDPGPGCTVPESADWTDPRLEHRVACAAPCKDGDVLYYQVAREGLQTLRVRLTTQGAPDTSGTRYYFVDLFQEKRTYRDFYVVLTPSAVRVRIASPIWGTEITGADISYHFASDGIELSIPTDALPFGGEAAATAGKGDDMAWDFGLTSDVCWDPSLPRGCMIY